RALVAGLVQHWHVYRHGLRKLHKLLPITAMLLPPTSPSHCTVAQLRLSVVMDLIALSHTHRTHTHTHTHTHTLHTHTHIHTHTHTLTHLSLLSALFHVS